MGDRRAKNGEKVLLYGASSKSLCVKGPLEEHEYVDEVPGKEEGCRGGGGSRESFTATDRSLSH